MARHPGSTQPPPPSSAAPSLALTIDPAALGPLIRDTVLATLAELDVVKDMLPGNRLAFSEAEAAAMLGLARHQLRDERLKGRIGASRGPGGRVLYARRDLEEYLLRGREDK